MQNFRRIRAWERAHTPALDVRRLTRNFPRKDYADLKSQITRAAESITYNIVEGSGAATRKEFARFLDVSIKSTSEVEYQLQLAVDYELLPPRTWRRLSAEAVEIRKMLYGFRRTLLSADDLPPRPGPDAPPPPPDRE